MHYQKQNKSHIFKFEIQKNFVTSIYFEILTVFMPLSLFLCR